MVVTLLEYVRDADEFLRDDYQRDGAGCYQPVERDDECVYSGLIHDGLLI